MGSMRTRCLVTGVVVVLLAGACRGDSAPANDSIGAGSTSHREDDTSEPQEVEIVAVDYAYSEAPKEIPAGVVNLTFENRGTVGHESTLTGIGDTPIEQWVEDLGGRTGLENSAFPDYIDQVAVPPFVTVSGGDTGHATFILTPGRYALWCSITDLAEGGQGPPHYALGMVREVTVSGGDPEPQLPPADGSITARDYTFDIDLEAGDTSVNFINEGPAQMHVSTVGVYPMGIDADEAERAFETQLEPGPPPQGVPTPKWLGFSGIYSEGLGGQFQLFRGEFGSGRTYVFACFLSDREGGKPHQKAYDMYAILTIE
jgi:hypothetical protein